MSANPLVAAPVDTTTATSGAGVVDSVSQLCSSLDSGSWLELGLSGVGAALDVAATVSDPLGSLIGAGLGWLMDHLEPLKGWLNDLTGDAGAVLGFAGTWQNVADATDAAADELDRVIRADLEAMTGASVLAYARYADDLAARIRASAGASRSIAGALKTCSTVVQVVHDLVRDTLAQLVGSIISWAAEAVFTLGLATPWIVEQVSTRVSSLAARVGKSVTEVVTSARSLKNLLEALEEALRGLRPVLKHADDAPTPHPHGAPAPTGGSYRPRPSSDLRALDWAENVYDQVRHDPDFVADLVRHQPDVDPQLLETAYRHVFHDEHVLGGGAYGEHYRGRFDSDPENADAWLRLARGEGTPTDRVMLDHEIAEALYERAHPGATYHESHAHANTVANWEDLI